MSPTRARVIPLQGDKIKICSRTKRIDRLWCAVCITDTCVRIVGAGRAARSVAGLIAHSTEAFTERVHVSDTQR